MMSTQILGPLAMPKPTRIATLLLGIATALLVLSILPASPSNYLLRAEYRGAGAAPATTWFSNLGYCVSSSSDAATGIDPATISCSAPTFGLDTAALAEEQTLPAGIFTSDPQIQFLVEALLTKQPAILIIAAAALCAVAMAAFETIPRRPRESTYVVTVAASMAGLLLSGFAAMFELSFVTLVRDGRTATAEQFTTTLGPVAYAVWAAVACQSVASTLGFYVCIGAKYRCEGHIRLGDDDDDGEAEKGEQDLEKGYAPICDDDDDDDDDDQVVFNEKILA